MISGIELKNNILLISYFVVFKMYYLDTDPAIIEDKIISFSQTLHSNHFVLLALKRRLLDLYRVLEANQKEETDQIALRKRLERQVT